jgi:hypothetical protein
MNEYENNLRNTEITNLIVYVPLIGLLYILYNYQSNNENENKISKLFFAVLLSFIVLKIDKLGGPFEIFKTKKDKVDYKKLIFIMIYISIVFLFYNQNKNTNNIINNIKKWFIIILIGLAFTFSLLNSEDETFLTFEYILYHWLVFIMIFLFYYFTNNNDYPYAKMYLTIMMIISIVFILIKPQFDIIFGFKTWKFSNYMYFNKNIYSKYNQKKNNKNVLNNLMNYIIINIILLSVYVLLTYTLLNK